MSKTNSTLILETNQIQNKPQENVFFHSLYRTQADFPDEFLRSAKSTSPIQIVAIFSTIGPDNLGAMLNIRLNSELEKIVAEVQKSPVLDFEVFSNRVLNVLNVCVCNFAVANGGAQMKTSMTMVVIEGDTLRVIHLGNTKAVLIRDNKIIGLTEEHTVARRYVQMGAIKPEEEAKHPENMTLTQYLGKMPQDGAITADMKVHVKLKDNDEICVMGLGISHDMPAQMRNVILVKPTPTEIKARELINSAYSYGIKAGLSAVCIKIESTFLLPGDAVINSNLSSDPSVAEGKNGNTGDTEGYTPFGEPPRDASKESDNASEETRNFNRGETADRGGQDDNSDEDKKFESPKTRKLRNVLIPVLILIICIAVGFGLMFLVFVAKGIVDVKQLGGRQSEVIIENEVFIKYIITDATPVYSESSPDSAVLFTLDRGYNVAVINDEDGFSQIRTPDNREGYVYSIQLSDEDPTINDIISVESSSDLSFIPEDTTTSESTTHIPNVVPTSLETTQSTTAPTTAATTAPTTTTTTITTTTVADTVPTTEETVPTDPPVPVEPDPVDPAPEG